MEVADSLQLIGAAQISLGLLVEDGACARGRKNRVDRGLACDIPRTGVEGARVHLDGLLAEVIDVVGSAVVDVEALHDLVLDFLSHGALGGNLHLLALGSGSSGFLGSLVVRGGQLVSLDLAANHLRLWLNAVQARQGLRQAHKRLAQREGVAVPEREVRGERPVQEARGRELGEGRQVALLEVRVGGSQEEQQSDKGHERDDAHNPAHAHPAEVRERPAAAADVLSSLALTRGTLALCLLRVA